MIGYARDDKVRERAKSYACGGVPILGVNIAAVNMDCAVRKIMDWIKKDEKQYVCVTGVHGIMACQSDTQLKAIHNLSGLTVPDGMPLIWIGRIYGFTDIGRVYGPDLMLAICQNSVPLRFSHFLYGGQVGVADDLKKRLENKYPGIRIVGTYTPPFRSLNPEEERELKEKVSDTKPDFFWVGLSTPKQESFMAASLPYLDTKVMIGVGAAFDIHTGRISDAPAWIKKIGMQWMHRLCQEPRRLWKRYLYNNPVFIFKIIQQLLRDRLRRTNKE